MKPLEGCEHVCSAKCHTGPCPPCSIMLVRPCRCGSTTREIRCSEDQARARARARGETGPDTEILCERPCGALRACGRHQCTRICCPLASLASLAKGKGKKRAGADVALMDEEGWHVCDLVCGKPLSCGNHFCEERDHRGACPPCLRSSFEEVRRFLALGMGMYAHWLEDGLLLWSYCPRPSDSLWHEDRLPLSVFPSSTAVRSSEDITRMSRRPYPLSSLSLPDQQAMRVWEEDG